MVRGLGGRGGESRGSGRRGVGADIVEMGDECIYSVGMAEVVASWISGR